MNIKNSVLPFFQKVLYSSYGVLAQLGARNIRIVEATGPNPVYSIITYIFYMVEFQG